MKKRNASHKMEQDTDIASINQALSPSSYTKKREEKIKEK